MYPLVWEVEAEQWLRGPKPRLGDLEALDLLSAEQHVL